jgi:predicted nucleotide-binding protein (sugar kinase/HSP70/actin superfamily)
MITVGIPRGLHYHDFGSFWQRYFANAGIATLVSPPTTKSIVDTGSYLAVDESCLPLKIYLGHVSSLLDKCSYLFVPRISHYHDNYFFCAKFAGLPDIVRNTFSLPPDRLISPNIAGLSLLKNYQECRAISRQIGVNPLKNYWAYRQARKSYQQDRQGLPPAGENMVAVIGHNYLLNDPFFAGNIQAALAARKIEPVFPDQVPASLLYRLAARHHSEIYWQLSAKLAGAVHYFAHQPTVKGILVISSFGCGPDSLINEYLDYHVLSRAQIPYMFLNFDEHTGHAGMTTRLEAFLDLIEWRE